MKTILTQLDHYFLSDDPEEIRMSDRIALYGFYIATGGIATLTAANLYL